MDPPVFSRTSRTSILLVVQGGAPDSTPEPFVIGNNEGEHDAYI